MQSRIAGCAAGSPAAAYGVYRDPKLTPHRVAGHGAVAGLEIHERYEVERAVSWPPWNAVEGPRDRSDDPGDQLEVFLYGVTARDLVRMRAIEQFFRAITRFRQAGGGVTSLDAFTLDIRVARDTLQFEQPIEFKAEMWVKGSDGKWQRRKQP